MPVYTLLDWNILVETSSVTPSLFRLPAQELPDLRRLGLLLSSAKIEIRDLFVWSPFSHSLRRTPTEWSSAHENSLHPVSSSRRCSSFSRLNHTFLLNNQTVKSCVEQVLIGQFGLFNRPEPAVMFVSPCWSGCLGSTGHVVDRKHKHTSEKTTGKDTL